MGVQENRHGCSTGENHDGPLIKYGYKKVLGE